ncbi:hypothetical protein BDR26DRAFT_888637 [Obelidium mucronatum]|nr:hypothetical protein BDR26DRAFT_888637 [Obelidium mucronatum]
MTACIFRGRGAKKEENARVEPTPRKALSKSRSCWLLDRIQSPTPKAANIENSFDLGSDKAHELAPGGDWQKTPAPTSCVIPPRRLPLQTGLNNPNGSLRASPVPSLAPLYIPIRKSSLASQDDSDAETVLMTPSPREPDNESIAILNCV